MTQKGFSPVILLIAGAIIVSIAVVAYGFWTFQSKPAEVASEVPTQTQAPATAIIHPADPECPDTDYTGCDTSSQFMTWTDDGERNPPAESVK